MLRKRKNEKMDKKSKNTDKQVTTVTGSVGLFGRMLIGQKIMTIVLLSMAFIMAVGAVGVTSMSKIGAEIEQISETDIPVIQSISAIAMGRLEQAILFERALWQAEVGDFAHLNGVVAEFDTIAQDVQAKIVETEHMIEGALQHASSAEQSAEFRKVLGGLTEIEKKHEAFDHEVNQVFALLRAGRSGEAHGLIESIEAEQTELNHELEAMLIEVEEFTLAAALIAGHEEKKAVKLIILIAAIATILCVSLSSLMTRNAITKPLGKVMAALKALADGNTDVEVEIKSRDEIGKLGEAFTVFRDKTIQNQRLEAEQAKKREEDERRAKTVEEMISEFDTTAKESLGGVSASAEQMKSSALSMTSIADEASQRSSSVAAASEEATVNVQTVATATEELSASVEEISRQVAQSAQMANAAVESANATNAKVEGLAEASQKIGEVVDLINDIAAQTNLLALNATIEASRAGEAGKGFAVVASEVKSLATQTAKATEEIGAQIASIQAETQDAVGAIQEIGKSIGEISDTATAIASAVEEQGAATREIAENVQQAAAGTQDVSSNITEVSRGAQETGSSAQQVLGAAEQLGTQSDELQAAVSSFLDRVKAA